MYQVDLLTSIGVGDDPIEVTVRGTTTYMGPNGWNPNPT
jgi:hypothetical protein